MSKYIFWKLQTRANQIELDVNSEEFKRFKMKYGKIYNEQYSSYSLRNDNELIDMYKRMAYKNPLFSQIYSLTLAYVHDNTIRIKYFTGVERDLILTFLNTLNDSHFSDYTLVQYDSEILLPYLGIRMDMNKIDVPLNQGLKYHNMKSWNLTSICLRNYFNGAGAYNHNLADMAYVYGISMDGIIDFTEENTAFLSGEFEALKQSAINEIKVCVNVFNKLIKEDIIDEVAVVEQKVENVAILKKTNPLEEIYSSNQFSNKVKTDIRKLCEKKRLTKKDKENLKVILRGVWVRTDFINNSQDNKKQIAEKEQEIKEFVDGL